MSRESTECRYGITSVDIALAKRGKEIDPHSVEIGYYDKVTQIQGSVKMMHHEVPNDLWPAINEGLNAILEHALERLRS